MEEVVAGEILRPLQDENLQSKEDLWSMEAPSDQILEDHD
jgi:hypothetical protein